MFLVLIFIAIVVTAEFLSGLILDRINRPEADKREEISWSNRFGTALGITILTMLIAFLFQGPAGIFDMSTQSAMPLLVLAAVAGAIFNALPLRPGSDAEQPSFSEINFGEVVRITIMGAMLRQLLMGIMAVLFFVSVVGIALLIGDAN